MTRLQKSIAALVLMVASATTAYAGDTSCNTNVEELRYSWRLRGGVRFLAGLVFPTSGVGNLKTTFPSEGRPTIASELLITAPNGRQGGFYEYETQMSETGDKTLMTYHGYAWGKKSHNERIVFDYAKGLARIREESPEEIENRVKLLPKNEDEFRDVLTAIYFLRQNAGSMAGPLTTSIYSDGKEYPVVFRPMRQRQTLTVEGKKVTATGFEIVDAPGGRKWPGGVKVWLSEDARRLPYRIEIQQSVASLQLDLQSVASCSAMASFSSRNSIASSAGR
jgi:hypothetical protein